MLRDKKLLKLQRLIFDLLKEHEPRVVLNYALAALTSRPTWPAVGVLQMPGICVLSAAIAAGIAEQQLQQDGFSSQVPDSLLDEELRTKAASDEEPRPKKKKGPAAARRPGR